MGLTILIRRDGSKPTTPRGRVGFTPHWNRAIDRKPVWISSKKQFDYELGKRGLELIKDSDCGKPHEPRRKDYVPSRETRSLVQAIKSQSKNGDFSPSGGLKHELRKRGILKTREEIHRVKKQVSEIPNTSKGGFYS